MTTAVAPAWTPATPVRHAAPLRAVDAYRLDGSGDERRIEARLSIRPDEENLRGHFPGLPIYPGIFVVESLTQAVTCALAGNGPPLRLRELRSARFLAPLLGGDELHMDIRAERRPDGAWRTTARCRRADDTVTAELRADLVEAADLAGPPAELVADRDPGPAADGEPAMLDHDAVRALLPQRHPLLLIDRVPTLEPGRSVRAVKLVTGTEPCYRSVPDGAPARHYDYPASLMLESLGQAAALLWLADAGAVGDDHVLMFVAARGYRVDGAARPGDVLRHEVELSQVKADTVFASGGTWVGGRRIAAADTLIAVRRPRSVLDPAVRTEAPLTTSD